MVHSNRLKRHFWIISVDIESGDNSRGGFSMLGEECQTHVTMRQLLCHGLFDFAFWWKLEVVAILSGLDKLGEFEQGIEEMHQAVRLGFVGNICVEEERPCIYPY